MVENQPLNSQPDTAVGCDVCVWFERRLAAATTWETVAERGELAKEKALHEGRFHIEGLDAEGN